MAEMGNERQYADAEKSKRGAGMFFECVALLNCVMLSGFSEAINPLRTL